MGKKRVPKKSTAKGNSKKLDYWTKPSRLKKVEGWSSDGLAAHQIAKNIGIALSTFYKWQNDSLDFSEAVVRGRRASDVEVENALRKRAMGYTVVEAKFVEVPYDDDELYILQQKEVNRFKLENPEATDKQIREVVDRVPTTRSVPVEAKERHIPADTSAARFWLSNRNPESWKEKQHQFIDGEMNINNKYEELTDDQLIKMAERFKGAVEND